jgi:hypothetical protein
VDCIDMVMGLRVESHLTPIFGNGHTLGAMIISAAVCVKLEVSTP